MSTRDLTRRLKQEQAREADALVRASREANTVATPESLPPAAVQHSKS